MCAGGLPAAASWRPRSRRRRAGPGAEPGVRSRPGGGRPALPPVPPARPPPTVSPPDPARNPPGQRRRGARGGWRRKKATVKGRGGEGACLPGSLRVCHARLARGSGAQSDLLSSLCAIKFETQGFPLVLYFIHALSPRSRPIGKMLFSVLFC